MNISILKGNLLRRDNMLCLGSGHGYVYIKPILEKISCTIRNF